MHRREREDPSQSRPNGKSHRKADSVRSPRRCSRNGCPKSAVATLTYVYADSTAVVGPLAAFAEPHSYDLCERHARGLTAPRGWDLVRHEGEFDPPPADAGRPGRAGRGGA